MATKKGEIGIKPVKTERLLLHIKGKTPLIFNAMSEKVRGDLLLPPKASRKKGATLKHDPVREFRGSAYRDKRKDAPTAVVMPSTAFKAAMGNAAIELEGVSKAGVNRLLYVNRDEINIYGIPEMMMSTVRMANAARTPDIRTRAVMREWAAQVEIDFAKLGGLTGSDVANLLQAAGTIIGVGDWRRQKGGDYGAFDIVPPEDAEFQRIVGEGGRIAQLAAFDAPQMYNDETEQLFEWFQKEAGEREFAITA